MKNIKPFGEYVLLRFKKNESQEKKTKAGLILMDEQKSESDKFYAEVIEFGNKVPDFREFPVAVGDKVIFNEYDLKKIKGDEIDEIYGIIKYVSIMGSYK